MNIAFTMNWQVKCSVEVNLTNPTGRCQTRPAGCCPSGPGSGRGLAVDQCGGPGQAECRHGSQHLPSWGPTGSPGRRVLGRPGRLHLRGKKTQQLVKLIHKVPITDTGR